MIICSFLSNRKSGNNFYSQISRILCICLHENLDLVLCPHGSGGDKGSINATFGVSLEEGIAKRTSEHPYVLPLINSSPMSSLSRKMKGLIIKICFHVFIHSVQLHVPDNESFCVNTTNQRTLNTM